ncbi:glycosyltransferase [Rhodobacteraceae bacterium ASV31]|nr:glycosyltransferase [Anianabacter salinae]
MAMCLCILVARRSMRAAPIRRGQDIRARQAMHHRPTSRLGGLAVFGGWLTCLPFLDPAVQAVSVRLALSAFPVIVAGLAEDLGHDVSPRRRLLAAGISGLVAAFLFGLWLPKVDVPVGDALFAFAPFAILFTVFCTSGVSHAFNLIDGMHGLAAGTAIIGAVGLSAVAVQSGQPDIAASVLVIAAATLGFLAINYPFGLVFLGDAGAYSIGHVLAWVSILILARDLDATAWAMVLVLFWPVADTCFAMYRRWKNSQRADQPDRLHHHQVVLRMLEIRVIGRDRRHLANPVATLVLLPFIAMPTLAGVLLWNNPAWAFAALVVFAALFVVSYRLVIGLAQRRPAGRASLGKEADRPPAIMPGE